MFSLLIGLMKKQETKDSVLGKPPFRNAGWSAFSALAVTFCHPAQSALDSPSIIERKQGLHYPRLILYYYLQIVNIKINFLCIMEYFSGIRTMIHPLLPNYLFYSLHFVNLIHSVQYAKM